MDTPAPYFGSKSEMTWIIDYFPDHRTYTEAFGGMAGLLLNKPASPVEVYNDVNGGLVNFFRAARNWPDELARAVAMTPVSYEEWHRASARFARSATREVIGDELPKEDAIEAARQFIVMARQSMAGAPGRSWQATVTHTRRLMGSNCSAWLNLPQIIQDVGLRFMAVQIERRAATHILRKYDHEDAVHYVDPPYHPDTCKTGVYGMAGGGEMSAAEHAVLLRCLRGLQGTVILSGYDHPLYEKWLVRRGGFEKVVREVPCRSAVTASGTVAQRDTREEVLWVRYSSKHADPRAGLFGGG